MATWALPALTCGRRQAGDAHHPQAAIPIASSICCCSSFLYHQKDMLEDHKRTGAYYNACMQNRRQFAGKVRPSRPSHPAAPLCPAALVPSAPQHLDPASSSRGWIRHAQLCIKLETANTPQPLASMGCNRQLWQLWQLRHLWTASAVHSVCGPAAGIYCTTASMQPPSFPACWSLQQGWAGVLWLGQGMHAGSVTPCTRGAVQAPGEGRCQCSLWVCWLWLTQVPSKGFLRVLCAGCPRCRHRVWHPGHLCSQSR